MPFQDRAEAGRGLAEALRPLLKGERPLVIGLPRGGIVTARVVADAFDAPLHIVVPRKIGAPENPEYAVGALTEAGDVIWNEEERARIGDEALRPVVEAELREAARRMKLYGGGLPPRDVAGKTVVVVDDGIATGLTMRAALATLRAGKPKRLIAAVPVAPPSSLEELGADEAVALERPILFGAIGAFYREFPPVSDEEVVELLKQKAKSLKPKS